MRLKLLLTTCFILITLWDDVINEFWNTAAPSVPNCPTGGCELPPGPLTVTNSVYLPLVQQ